MQGVPRYPRASSASLCRARRAARLRVEEEGRRPPHPQRNSPARLRQRTPTRAQSAGRGGAAGRGRGQRGRSRAGGARGARGGEARAWPAQAGQAVAEAAVAAGMGDGGAERDRGPARRESQSGRGGEGGGAEDSSADAAGRSPREIAGTSDSSPAGSRESGADSDGQPGLGEADHCRRILVRGKGRLEALAPWTPLPSLTGASDLPAASTSQVLYPFRRSSSSHSFSKHYLEGLLCAGH